MILSGIALLILELFIIPGISVAGIGGAIALIVAIVGAYSSHPPLTANIFLSVSLLLIITMFVIALRANTWQRIALKENITGNVNNDVELYGIKSGDKGITVSRLAPMGRIMVNAKNLEAHSEAGFIDEQTEIIIHRISENNIYVKPLINN